MARIGAAPVVLSILAGTCVALALTAANATHRLQSPFGVSGLGTAQDGSVWLIFREQLVRLSPQGYRLGAWSAKQLQVPSPMQALAVADEGVWLGAGGQLVRIGDDGRMRQRVDPTKTEAGPFSRRFQLAFDAQRNHVWVSDAAQQRLLAFDAQGRLIQTARTRPDAPQGMGAHATGLLLVAIAGRNALTQVLPGPQLQHWGSAAPDQVQLGHYQPGLVSVQGDTVYASWHDENFRQGSVTRYDLHGQVLQRLPLPPGIEPQALLAREHDLLVAARLPDGYTLLRYEPATGRLDEFGDADLRWALRQATREELRLMQVRAVAMSGLAVSLLLLIVLSTRFWRARGARKAQLRESEDVPTGLPTPATVQEG